MRRAVRGTCCTCRSAAAGPVPRYRLTGLMHDSVSSNGTPRAAPRRMTSALLISAYGASTLKSCASPNDNARAIVSLNSGVASGNGLWPSVPSTMRSMPRRGAKDAGLREQDDVAPGKVDVLVGRVVRRRPAGHRPVRGRVDVAHVHGKRDDVPARGRAADRFGEAHRRWSARPIPRRAPRRCRSAAHRREPLRPRAAPRYRVRPKGEPHIWSFGHLVIWSLNGVLRFGDSMMVI